MADVVKADWAERKERLTALASRAGRALPGAPIVHQGWRRAGSISAEIVAARGDLPGPWPIPGRSGDDLLRTRAGSDALRPGTGRGPYGLWLRRAEDSAPCPSHPADQVASVRQRSRRQPIPRDKEVDRLSQALRDEPVRHMAAKRIRPGHPGKTSRSNALAAMLPPAH